MKRTYYINWGGYPRNHSAPDMTGAMDSCKDISPQVWTAWGRFYTWGGEGHEMRSEYMDDAALDAALLLLTEPNRLCCQLAIATGLRISDCLGITTAQLSKGQRITVREAKTGKSRRVHVPKLLHAQLLAQAGEHWVFEGARDAAKHRTRQAVWHDLKRAAIACRIPANLTPHSLRKIWAVRDFQRDGNLSRMQRTMNHSDPGVTLLYVMADRMAAAREPQGSRRPSCPR